MVKPFLANLHTKKYSYMYSMTLKNFISSFSYEYQNCAEFHVDFKSMEIIGKKCTKKKIIHQKRLQVTVVLVVQKTKILHTFLHATLYKQIFRIFLNSYEISIKLCIKLIPILKFCEEKVFRSYQHFFETLKPNSIARNG